MSQAAIMLPLAKHQMPAFGTGYRQFASRRLEIILCRQPSKNQLLSKHP